MDEERRYYVAAGKSLGVIEKFFEDRKAAYDARYEFAKSKGGIGTFGSENGVIGIVPIDGKPSEELRKRLPAPPAGYRLEDRGDYFVWAPNGRLKGGKVAKNEIRDKRFCVPGSRQLAEMLGGGDVFTGRFIHYPHCELVGNKWIISIPVRGTHGTFATSYEGEFHPPDAIPLKVSEYWKLKEAVNLAALPADHAIPTEQTCEPEKPMTTPQLLARAIHGPCFDGPHRCFFCGAACGEEFPATAHVSDTFTAYGEVARPDSRFVCGGCVMATDEADRSQRPRMFSWIIAGEAKRIPKSDVATLADACLSPPDPPFAIVLAVSGQKHLLYRTPVNHGREVVTVALETERITFRPEELADRLSMCKRIAAACGKPSLAERPNPAMVVRLAQYHEDFEPLLAWCDVWQEPLSRLCAHLCPKMEICREQYPSTCVPATPARDVRRAEVSRNACGSDGPGLFGG